MKKFSEEEKEVYLFINKFFKLKYNNYGWYVEDLLGNKVDESNILTVLYALFGFDNKSALIYNQWIMNTRNKLIKPFLLFLEDYQVIEVFNKKITVNKKTGDKININYDYISKTDTFPLIILKDIYLWWFSKNS